MENVHILTHQGLAQGDFVPFTQDAFRREPSLDLQHLVVKLQTTLDVHELIGIYAGLAQRQIDFVGLTIHSIDGSFEASYGKAEGNSQVFDIKAADKVVARLAYFFGSRISPTYQSYIKQLHQALAYPLRNALMYSHVKRLATKDALTGLGNRSYFDDYLLQRLAMNERKQQGFSLMMLDLDNFKQVNDKHGHAMGDDILREFADILGRSVRGTDCVFRFGGDEFAIIVDDNNFMANQVVANRIRHAVLASKLLSDYHVTCSIGFTQANHIDTSNDLFDRADHALYEAKKAGRNCFRHQ